MNNNKQHVCIDIVSDKSCGVPSPSLIQAHERHLKAVGEPELFYVYKEKETDPQWELIEDPEDMPLYKRKGFEVQTVKIVSR